MNRTLQILLLAAFLLPLFGTVRAETLEERKKRITRKYMRERSKITQSELVVPSDQLEDERILESEKFKEPEVDLSRKSGPAPAPMPRRPMPRPPAQEDNWLLQGTEDEESDPYADPFALDKPKESSPDYWASRNRQRESSRYNSGERSGPYADRSRSPYDRSGSYADRNRSPDSGNSGSSTLYGQTSLYGNGDGADSQQQARTDLFGRPLNPSTAPAATLNTPRTYGAAPDTGLLGSPFPQRQSQDTTTDPFRRRGTEAAETGGFTPYQSPYQSRQTQRTQPWNNQSSSQQPEEYRKPDAVKQWRERNKTFDPTKDDAYLDELMQRNRR